MHQCKLSFRVQKKNIFTFKISWRHELNKISVRKCGHRCFCGWLHFICICRSLPFRGHNIYWRRVFKWIIHDLLKLTVVNLLVFVPIFKTWKYILQWGKKKKEFKGETIVFFLPHWQIFVSWCKHKPHLILMHYCNFFNWYHLTVISTATFVKMLKDNSTFSNDSLFWPNAAIFYKLSTFTLAYKHALFCHLQDKNIGASSCFHLEWY